MCDLVDRIQTRIWSTYCIFFARKRTLDRFQLSSPLILLFCYLLISMRCFFFVHTRSARVTFLVLRGITCFSLVSTLIGLDAKLYIIFSYVYYIHLEMKKINTHHFKVTERKTGMCIPKSVDRLRCRLQHPLIRFRNRPEPLLHQHQTCLLLG